MSNAFQRQRRNLFVVSGILLVLCLGEVEIKDLVFAGMTFGAFKRPEIFFIGIWIAQAYYFYRFFVYVMEDCADNLKHTWSREFERAVNPRIERLVRRAYPDPNKACLFSYTFVRRDRFTWKGQALLPMEGDIDMMQYKDVIVPIVRRAIVAWEAKALLRFLLVTPATTEYFVPAAVAFATFIYCGFIARWAGSMYALAA